MWLRCKNSKSGHEASIPLGLVQSGAMPDWTPLKDAKPTAMPVEPAYHTTTAEPVSRSAPTPLSRPARSARKTKEKS